MERQTTSDGTLIHTFETGEEPRYMRHDPRDDRFAFSFPVRPRGTYIAILKPDGGGESLRETQRLENMDRPLTFLSDGRLVALGAWPEEKRVGSMIFAESGELLETIDTSHMTTDATQLPDGSVAFLDHVVKVWHAGALRDFERKTDDSPVSIHASPDGQYIVTVNAETYLRVWDVAKGKQLTRITTSKYTPVRSCFSPDGSSLVHGAHDDADAKSPMKIVLHDVNKKWPVRESLSLPSAARVTNIGFSADGSRMWVVQQQNSDSASTLSLWDRDQQCVQVIEQPVDDDKLQIRDVALRADGRRAYVLLASWDQAVRARFVSFPVA